MNDLRRPSLAEFIERARQYDVRRFDIMVQGVAQTTVVLVRPSNSGPHRRVTINMTQSTDPLPSETIVRYCRALGLKPHDFGVFIG